MAHTSETTFLGLPVYGADDKGTWLGDINGTNSKIDTFAATISGSVDSLDTIANAAKDSADASAEAVSEMSGDITALEGSVNTINSLIGNGTPTTTDKTLIGAINELKSDIDNMETPDADEIAFDNTGTSIVANNVEDAIKEVAAGGGGGVGDWTLIDSISTTGTTGSTDTKAVTIPTSAKELLIRVKVGGGLQASTIAFPNERNIAARFVYAPNSATITQSCGTTLNTNSELEVYINYAAASITVEGELYYR